MCHNRHVDLRMAATEAAEVAGVTAEDAFRTHAQIFSSHFRMSFTQTQKQNALIMDAELSLGCHHLLGNTQKNYVAHETNAPFTFVFHKYIVDA